MAKTRVRLNASFFKKNRRRIDAITREVAADQGTARQVQGLIIRQIRNERILPDDSYVKPLANSSIRTRRYLQKFNRVSNFYSPLKSNLTFTGKFLGSFKPKVIKAARGMVRYVFGPTGSRSGYKTKNGVGGKISNEQIGEYLIEGGRDYREVGGRTLAKIKEVMIARATRAVRRAFR